MSGLVAALVGALHRPGGGASPITANLVPSRTSGPAPLFVHLDASDTTMTAAAVAGGPIHELTYAFQRRGAAASAFLNGRSNRNAKTGGPIWGVALEAPGTEYIDLTVTRPGASAILTQPVTVLDPDTYFAGTNTVLASVAGVFTGSGKAGFATLQPGSNADITAQSGKRILLRRGETYGRIYVPLGVADFQFGVYGSGAKPIVRAIDFQSSTSTYTWGHTGAFWDIDYIETIRIPMTTHDVLFLRVNSTGGAAGTDDLKVNIGGNIVYDMDPVRATPEFLAAIYWPRHIGFVDCDIQGVINDTYQPNVCIAGNVSKSCFLGVTTDLAREFPMRLFFQHHTILDGCDMGGNVYQQGKHPLKLQSNGTAQYNDMAGVYGANVASRVMIVSNSRFGPPGSNNDWLVGAGPENTDPETVSALYDYIFEDNVFARGPNTGQDLHACGVRFTTRGNTVQSGGTFNGDMVTSAEYPSGGTGRTEMKANYCGPYYGQLTT